MNELLTNSICKRLPVNAYLNMVRKIAMTFNLLMNWLSLSCRRKSSEFSQNIFFLYQRRGSHALGKYNRLQFIYI